MTQTSDAWVSALIPAAGFGQRMGGGTPKPFLQLNGTPILCLTLAALARCGLFREFVVVAGENNVADMRRMAEGGAENLPPLIFLPGGSTRQESVFNGLQALAPQCEIVVIHDAVRPLVSPQLVVESVRAAQETGAAVAAVPVKDTVIEVNEEMRVAQTLDRSRLWAVQTPQTFRRELILEAHRRARADGFSATDDGTLVLRLGHTVKIVRGAYENIKITTREDLVIAGDLLRIATEPPSKDEG